MLRAPGEGAGAVGQGARPAPPHSTWTRRRGNHTAVTQALPASMGKQEGKGGDQAARQGGTGGSGRGRPGSPPLLPSAHPRTQTRAGGPGCLKTPLGLSGSLSLGSGAGRWGARGKKTLAEQAGSLRRCLKKLLPPPLEVVHQQPVQPASINVRSTPNHPPPGAIHHRCAPRARVSWLGAWGWGGAEQRGT